MERADFFTSPSLRGLPSHLSTGYRGYTRGVTAAEGRSLPLASIYCLDLASEDIYIVVHRPSS
jgi:hypothetical protein